MKRCAIDIAQRTARLIERAGVAVAPWVVVLAVSEAPARTQVPARVDLTTFRDRVQPIFLDKRPRLARCYVCHSQGTAFRLQRLGPGRTSWTDEETPKNFEAVQRLITPGAPESSRLLLMPLAHEGGGTPFHPGGKRWMSQSDPEWKELALWIKTAGR